MSEAELLGKLAYEAYMQSEYTNNYIRFEHLSERDQRAWIASAKAVAEQVMLELQVANEASGA